MTTATRTLDGIDLPAPGRWDVDPGHAEVGFVGRHFGLTKVRGRFNGVGGTITIGDDVESSSLDITIDMASVNSGDQSRDEHLRSNDFFDVAHHPTASFRSTAVRADGAAATVIGDLTIKGVTRPVRLAVEYLGHVVDPWGDDRAIFTASGKINREDWGLTWNMLLDAGGILVSKEIVLEIEVELVRAGE